MILRHPVRLALAAALPLLAVAACDRTRDSRPVEETAPPADPGAARLRQAIETATFTPPPAPPPAGETAPGDQPDRPAPDDTRPDPAMARAQILLDRTRFSPGIVDGLGGENTRQAIAAFEKANGLPVDGELDATVFERLATGDGRRVLTDHTITQADLAGPFIGTVPEDIAAMGRLQTVGYANPREALAEKFHMSEALLDALNPGVDFGRAGQTIVVAAPGPNPLRGEVARIVVDKAESSVRAFAADGTLLAFYPATIGSGDTPSPSGTHTVRAVAPRPNYTYDPSRVSYGDGGSKVVVPPGPNNPVGSVWIDLSRDTYGIHGTPDPAEIGKTASSGCVRLTNWDAEQLASAVKPGVEVRFT
ncbi:L,D-transpeptidase [Roseibacterium beibuensis]|uniref:L,D-transpeptidase family protein n=1 Tax=[Roseibacterium] beibuensis TaxID=1193142 RepID=UPI00217E1E1F|nr:L,D-transpeptidase [Roseibacterium beibuensis]MCS6625700.1 L,D-transpeptidase [Roseibacterium beibuensis]